MEEKEQIIKKIKDMLVKVQKEIDEDVDEWLYYGDEVGYESALSKRKGKVEAFEEAINEIERIIG